MRRIIVWLGVGLVAALGIIAAVTVTRPYTFHGSAIQQAYQAPDFSLPLSQGSQFQLAQQRGHLVIIFFGFTNCPDICPTTLADFKQIHRRLGKDAGRVEFIFITVDPARDTPTVVNQYAARFDPAFIGLSGTEQQLAPVWKAYGVYRKLDKKAPSDTVYDVEHSTQIYLVDTSGNLRLTYSYGTSVDDILQDVRYLLKNP